MSDRASATSPADCSGLANIGVPTNPPWVKFISPAPAIALASPKSITLTSASAFSDPADESMILAGFRSRWIKPCAAAATRARET